MKVLVGIKRALDYAARVRVRPDGSGVDLAGARMSVNPFCEIALEVREKGVKEGCGCAAGTPFGLSPGRGESGFGKRGGVRAPRTAGARALGRERFFFFFCARRVPGWHPVHSLTHTRAARPSSHPPQEAVRLKEAGTATEVVAVSVGPPQCQVSRQGKGARASVFFSSFRRRRGPSTSPPPRPPFRPPRSQDQLRTALALGADRAIHVSLGASDADPAPTPRAVAAVLAALIAREAPPPALVLLGKQAIDDDASAVGPLVAAALGWPQANFASKVVVGGDGASVTVTREVDGGLATVRASLPAVVTADLRLNTPRFPALPAIMKAKKRPVESVDPADLGPAVAEAVAGAPQVVTVRVEPPPPRPPGIKVGSAAELVDRLVKDGRLAVG